MKKTGFPGALPRSDGAAEPTPRPQAAPSRPNLKVGSSYRIRTERDGKVRIYYGEVIHRTPGLIRLRTTDYSSHWIRPEDVIYVKETVRL